MFMFRDPLDFGQPADPWAYKVDYQALNFDRLFTDIRDVFDDDIVINGKPNPVLFDDAMDFGF